MNVLEPFNAAFLAGLVVFTWTRHIYATRTKAETKAVRRFDTQERILLAAMCASTFLLPLLYLFTPWLGFADYRLPEILRWLGTATMVAALWLFWRSHADLGQNWSVSLELREGHQLVRHGVYRFVRHPMYASIWLWALAQGLLLQNWLAGWALLPVFGALYALRTPREERLMCEAFGDDYRAYMRQTGRLVPRIAAFRSRPLIP